MYGFLKKNFPAFLWSHNNNYNFGENRRAINNTKLGGKLQFKHKRKRKYQGQKQGGASIELELGSWT